MNKYVLLVAVTALLVSVSPSITTAQSPARSNAATVLQDKGMSRDQAVNTAEKNFQQKGNLSRALRDELRQRAIQYNEDVAGAGGTSNIVIHWPTVILIVVLIILAS